MVSKKDTERLCAAAESGDLWVEYVSMNPQSQRVLAKEYGRENRDGYFRRCLRKAKEVHADRYGDERLVVDDGKNADDYVDEARAAIDQHSNGAKSYDKNSAVIQDLTAALNVYRGQVEGLQKWQEFVRHVIASNVRPVKPLTFPKPTSSKRVDHAAIMCLSDIHVGEWVDADETGQLSQYNWDIFLTRRDELLRRFTNNVSDFRRAYRADTLYIFGLGDFVTGEDIFPKQLSRVDIGLTDQVLYGAQEIGKLILAMASQFSNTRVFLQYGNHGRTQTTTMNNDVMCYLWIKQLLVDQPNIDVHVSKTPFTPVTISQETSTVDFGDSEKEWNFLLLHGNEARGWMGMPFYGFDRTKRREDGMAGFIYDAMFVGHHHVDAHAPGWYANGSWVGGTDYSIQKMQAAGRPTQHLHMLAPEEGVGWNIDLFLDDAPSLPEPNKMGVRVDPMFLPDMLTSPQPTRR